MLEHLNLAAYWSGKEIAANFIILLNLLGSLSLGFMVGYERSYHGRAAGMRTFGLVCMASCAMTVFTGYPGLWFAGHNALTGAVPDPTRVVQGILTGIGFLGAGMILKEGYTISGLSTAASIWTCAAIGVLVGIGFYMAAISLAVLATLSMTAAGRVERALPRRESLQITLVFAQGYKPVIEKLIEAADKRGYDVPRHSLAASFKNGRHEWSYLATARTKGQILTVAELSNELDDFPGVEAFTISPARN